TRLAIFSKPLSRCRASGVLTFTSNSELPTTSKILFTRPGKPPTKSFISKRDPNRCPGEAALRISVERRDFNTAVQNYNTAIKSFPAVFYAGAFGFSAKPYFAATAGAETPPKVQFDLN